MRPIRAGTAPEPTQRAGVAIGSECAGAIVDNRQAIATVGSECSGKLASLAEVPVGSECQGQIGILALVSVGSECQGFIADAPIVTPTYPNGYKHYLPLIIHQDRVPGGAAIANAILLIDDTFPDLRTVANGGKVEHASGFDIRMELDDGTVLNYRRDTWDGTTGRFVALWRLPSASATVRTSFRIYVGKPGLVASEANPGLVYTSFSYAWDCRTGEDLTGQGRTMTPTSITTGTAIGDAGQFNGTTSKLEIANLLAANGLTAITIEAIVKPGTGVLDAPIFSSGPAGATTDPEMGLQFSYEDPGVAGGAAATIGFKLAVQTATTVEATRVNGPANSQAALNVVQYLAGRWQSGSAASLVVNGIAVTPSNTPVARTGTTLVERG